MAPESFRSLALDPSRSVRENLLRSNFVPAPVGWYLENWLHGLLSWRFSLTCTKRITRRKIQGLLGNLLTRDDHVI